MFSNLSRILATLALIMGTLQLGIGVAIAWGALGPREAALNRFTGGSSSGEAINEATLVIVCALTLGAPAEIGVALRKAHK